MRLIILAATMQIVVMSAAMKLTTAPVQTFNGKYTPLLAPAGYCGTINLTVIGSYNMVDPRPGCASKAGTIALTDNSGHNTLVAGTGMQLRLVNGSSMWQNEQYDLRSLPADLRTSGDPSQTLVQFKASNGWQTALTLTGVPVQPLSAILALAVH